MEPTVTQNSALYLAHQRISNRRSAFFRLVSAKGRLEPVDSPRLTFSPQLERPLHPDNGR